MALACEHDWQYVGVQARLGEAERCWRCGTYRPISMQAGTPMPVEDVAMQFAGGVPLFQVCLPLPDGGRVSVRTMDVEAGRQMQDAITELTDDRELLKDKLDDANAAREQAMTALGEATTKIAMLEHLVRDKSAELDRRNDEIERLLNENFRVTGGVEVPEAPLLKELMQAEAGRLLARLGSAGADNEDCAEAFADFAMAICRNVRLATGG